MKNSLPSFDELYHMSREQLEAQAEREGVSRRGDSGQLIAAIMKNRKKREGDLCPGCGEKSSWTPDLCPECLGKLSEKVEKSNG